jgi:UDP-N-acetylglucosamine 1-carboxyvinyltransferase
MAAPQAARIWPRGKPESTQNLTFAAIRDRSRTERAAGSGPRGVLMDRIRIVGGRPLNGTIPISGAKNATLPLMIASLLTEETLILDNVPRLADVVLLERILNNHGVDIMTSGKRLGESADAGQTLHISASRIVDTTAPYELVSKMRASFWVLAPLLARMGKAKVSLPGGCAIGTRPVDLLIMAMERLGAKIDIDAGYVVASAPKGLKGAEIVFPKVTVGGTHTALMAASLANGTTVIENAAREPEIGDVAECLNKMGARISGAGSSRITIEGVAKLHGARHAVVPDRIETGTYAMATAMAGGDILLQNARPEHLQAALDVLERTGTKVTPTNQGIRITRNGSRLEPIEVTTAPFPEFPTDLQAQLMALTTRANGTSHIVETVFENRFMHVQELARLGARIRLDGERATIEGVDQLKGAPVMATDLRASVSLVIAALAAEGETIVNRIYHLDRGFERLEEKLGRCGAAIERLSG